MKPTRWIAALLAAGLLLSTTAVVSAQEPQGGDRQGFVGTVSSFAGADQDGQVTQPGNLVLQPLEGTGPEPVTLFLAEGLEIRYPGRQADAQTGVGIQVADLQEAAERNSKVAVLAEWDGAQWAALQVTVTPQQPLNQPVQGAVVGIEDGTLTIMLPDGTTKTIQLGQGAAQPQVGELVTAFARPRGNGEEGEPGGPPVSTGLVRAEEVRQRVEGFLRDLTAEDAQLPDEATERRAQRIADLAEALENHASRHVDILQSLSERENLPQAARAGMLNALQNAQRGREQARANAEEARTRIGPPAVVPGRPGGAGDGAEEDEDEAEGPGRQGDQGGQADQGQQAGPPAGQGQQAAGQAGQGQQAGGGSERRGP